MIAAAAIVTLAHPLAASGKPDAGGPWVNAIRNEGGRLVDADGRNVVLRGINVVDKQGWTGTLAPPMLTPDLVAQLADAGFNHLRFGMTWASIEHDRDRFDEAYIDQFIAQLDLLADAGIAAIVDMHQDTWGGAIGSDGAPAWADPQCNELPDTDPSATTGQWVAEYASPAVIAAWSNFWNDGYGEADPHCTGPVQSEFVEMWGHLASRLAGHPAVIGYDLLNEPWPTTPPGVFEQVHLMPMYRRVAAAIRAHDRGRTPIFFGPPLYSPAVPTIEVSPPDPNAVFAPHIYTETMFSGGAVTTHAATDELSLTKDVEDARRMGVPVWIGEWGAIHDATYVREMYDLFDRAHVGASFWANVQTPGDRLAAEHEPPHVRPYPEAYPGVADWAYDAVTNTFGMTVTVPAGTHEVRIVVPRRLGLATSDPAVRFLGVSPTARRCPTKLKGDAGACRAVWTVTGPGTFSLTLRPADG